MLGFWIFFGIVCIMTVPFGYLANKWTGVFITLIIAFVISGLFALDSEAKRQEWNNGICNQCGQAEYKFSGAAKSRSGHETLYYVCPNCDNLIRQ